MENLNKRFNEGFVWLQSLTNPDSTWNLIQNGTSHWNAAALGSVEDFQHGRQRREGGVTQPEDPSVVVSVNRCVLRKSLSFWHECSGTDVLQSNSLSDYCGSDLITETNSDEKQTRSRAWWGQAAGSATAHRACEVFMTETHTHTRRNHRCTQGSGLPHMTSSRSFFGNHFLMWAGWRERGAAAAAGFDIKAAATHDALLCMLVSYGRTSLSLMSTHKNTPVATSLERMCTLGYCGSAKSLFIYFYLFISIEKAETLLFYSSPQFEQKPGSSQQWLNTPTVL